MGTIADSTMAVIAPITDMEKEIKKFVLLIAIIALIMSALFIIIGIARGGEVLNTIILGGISILVANVP